MAYAATLQKSFREQNPNTAFFVFIADHARPFLEVLGDDARIIVVDQAIAPNYERMAACYSIMEYNTAVKPHCFDYAFDTLGFDAVCYLDPDILVTSSLEEIFHFLESGDDCVVTPHITAPLSDGMLPGDLEISRAGIYNFGFIALRNSVPARRFVAWWRNWLETHCIVDLPNGLFVDQKFGDFVPAFIERTRIVHDPGYNVAYWNLVHRPIEHRDGKLFASGSLVKFIHFSGINKEKPEEFSKHQDRFTRATIGELQPTFDNYIVSLKANDIYGDVRFSTLKYGFGEFRSGVHIIDPMRRCIRRYYSEIPDTQSPFDLQRDFFLKPSEQFPGIPQVSRLVAELYSTRPEFKEAFSVSRKKELNSWGEIVLCQDYGLDVDWARCLEAVELPLWTQISHSRLRPRGELLRATKLFLFYVRSWLARELLSKQNLDDLAWNLAYSFETFPPVWRIKLVSLLGIDSDPRRRKLFEHWLRERGFFPNDMEAVAPQIDSGKQRRPTALTTFGGADRPGLAIYGFLDSETGLGQAGRALARAFETTGAPMSCHAIQAQGFENGVAFPSSNSLENQFNIALLAINADNIKKLEQYLDPRLLSHNRKIGLFFWELPVFPAIWAGACDAVDEIWVASRFVANSLKSATNKPVHIVSLPVPLNDLDMNESRRAIDLPADRLIYLVSFDFNSFPQRKNPMGAITAFADAFPKYTDSSPMLIVKCHGAYNRSAYEMDLRAAVACNANIILIDRVMSASEMLRLQAATDVYVSLHRSEGFGLNLAECMAAEKLVIGTNFSGNLDFMNETNSILVDYDMAQVKEGEYVAWAGQWWASPRHDDAVSALRLAERSTTLRAQLGEAARRHIATELSYRQIGQRMTNLVELA